MNVIKIVNVETGEEIVREMNADELAQWEADKTKAEADKLAKAEASAAKAALLNKLGITEDEAKLLLS
jgi:hypothetical protein